MLGRYSVDALAAVVLGHTYFSFSFSSDKGFGHAEMPLVTSVVSIGDNQKIRRVARMALWLSALFCVACFGRFWFSGAVLEMFGQDTALSSVAQSYLRIVGFALLPVLILIVIKDYRSSLEWIQFVLFITLGGCIINIPLYYCLFFGNCGRQNWACWARPSLH